jgi:hypothetical protein
MFPSLKYTPWKTAQFLVDQGEATAEDFWLGCGYAGWAPGQLQDELERGNWFTVATDSQSLSDLLEEAHRGGITAGNVIWDELMRRIRKEDLLLKHPQEFEDVMLREWIKDRMLPPSGPTVRSNWHLPGTVIRASSPILLDEQVFHHSILLILDSDERGTTGLILNRPSSTTIDLSGKTLPLMYGGGYGLGGEGKPETWLHCAHSKLREARVGTPIGQSDSMFWNCSRQDAETAVEMGLADPTDFMVVWGLSLWERNKVSFGVPLTKVELAASFSNVKEETVPEMWTLLTRQEPLNNQTMAKNLLEVSNAAWSLSRATGDQEDVTADLADEALRRWVAMFLMKS